MRFFGSALSHAIKLIDMDTVPVSAGELAQPEKSSPGRIGSFILVSPREIFEPKSTKRKEVTATTIKTKAKTIEKKLKLKL